jgi:integral membrane protein
LLTIKNFRLIALAEATSFLLLITASAFKRIPDPPPDGAQTAVLILGMIHGLLFVAYVLVALSVREDARWTGKETLLVLVGAVVPFGGYAVDRWLAKREQRLA